MEFFYTDERNAQIAISLLKAHNIRKVVASPGTTNVCFVASIQHDDYFQIYSAADERSAGYIACGLSAESGEPVVLSCTGATASRNYMPALTEAYYRKLPILVITSSRSNFQIGHNIDQVTDRTKLPNDVVKLSVQLPLIFNDEAEWGCIIAANKAMLELQHHGNGPVHINLETNYSSNFKVKALPYTPAIHRFTKEKDFPHLTAKKVAIMVGSHLRWYDELTSVVDEFCEIHNAVVLCDHTSNYKGKYRVLANLAAQQRSYESVIKNVDVMVHIGDVSASKYNINCKEVWRVNPDGELRDPYKKLKYVFETDEELFFAHYTKDEKIVTDKQFIDECSIENRKFQLLIEQLIPQLPFSNIWIASQLSKRLPQNSVLHLGIQNSLRSMNFFEIPDTILSYSNTGGFGIDGCLSATIGASLANEKQIFFCVLGDLAFFYDMNSLGNRHIGKNIRILLINNGLGTEFKIESNPAYVFGAETNDFIAAAGHYGSKSHVLVKHYAEDLGFEYITASNKNEFNNTIEYFASPEHKERPIIFEVFTDDKNENEALHKIRNIIKKEDSSKKAKTKEVIKDVLGERGINAIKKIVKNK